MSDNLITGIVSIVLAIIALATFATAVSPKAQTGSVIQAGAGGLATDIAAATAPVTGGGMGFSSGLTAPSLSNGFG